MEQKKKTIFRVQNIFVYLALSFFVVGLISLLIGFLLSKEIIAKEIVPHVYLNILEVI